jgi:Zn-dependent protease with chaperone function
MTFLLVLVVAAGLAVVAPLPIAWRVLVVGALIAVAGYDVIDVAGSRLNARFDQAVSEFIAGEQATPPLGPEEARAFSRVLMALLPLLLYALLFGLYATFVVALLGFALLEQVDFPVLVLTPALALGLLLLATLAGVAAALFRLLFPYRPTPIGLRLSRERHAPFWQVAAEVARAVDAKPIDEVHVVPGPGMSVHEDGSLPLTLAGRGRRVLQVGVTALYGMRVDELRAILAHEYGHFNHGDTRWASFCNALGGALVSALEIMPGVRGPGGYAFAAYSFALANALAGLNPAYWILRLIVRLYSRTTAGFSRLNEVRADIAAVELYGPDALANGLTRIYTNDRVFRGVAEPRYLENFNRHGTRFPSMCDLMAREQRLLGADGWDSYRREAESQLALQHEYETHPPMGIRLQYARRWAPATQPDERPVTVLFDDWDALDQQAAKVYNEAILEARRY